MTTHASMNRAYTLVWNDQQQAYVAAPETARRRGKRASLKVVAAAVATLFSSGVAHALDPGALPAGGVVTAGQAAIGQNGNTMTIQQTTGKAAIDWQSFNIGSGAQVNFVQPSASAVALNRVVGQDASRILGGLHANGQVFLLNPNGVLFAPGAQVSAAGVLASTRGISNQDFMAGKLTFSGNGSGTVVNQGAITAADGGYVVLVGAQVRNSGTISAAQGDVRLAAANQVSLQIAGAGLTAFAVDQGTLDALAENNGLIKADGGRIYLTADALDQLARATVNNTGVIEAHTVENRNGTIVLMGDMQHGTTLVGGTLDVSAPNGGDGGFIETSAAQVKVDPAARITAAAPSGKTGNWLIDPVDFTIAASGGDITGAQLSSALGSSNVMIQSTSGAAGTAGDVNVNDVVSWSANKLTLNAQRNINVNANMNGSGTASLALQYGQGALASGNTSTYTLANSVKIALPSGNTFSTRRGSDGAVTNFYVINALGAEGSSTTTDLQGMRAGVTGNYALGADIDASATSTWQSGQGFTFIGTQGNVFSGNFEGLGHAINGLYQNWAIGYIGLFGRISSTARVANVNLTNVNIRGGLDNVGGLVGYNDQGLIEHVTVQGTVYGANNNVGGVVGFNDGKVNDAHAVNIAVTGRNYATGGLIGRQSTNGVATASDSSGTASGFYDVGGLIGSSTTNLDSLHSSVAVTVTGGESGGLVGRASGNITNSYATGAVSAPGGSMIGGLVGQADGAISNSYATGNVLGTGGYTGGLAGRANGAVSGSHATGKVDGAHIVGGLAGFVKAGISVSDSYASGNVTGTLYSVGGLVGLMGGNLTNSYATGNVFSATDAVGGLVGSWSSGTNPELRDSYATGTVTGRYAVGGLVGDMSACFCFVRNSHATGKITGTADYVGGLVGYVDLGEINDSWASGEVSGVSNVGGVAGQGVNISNSYATGKVSGANNIGGLVGLEKMGGSITGASYATGNVNGTVDSAGGLVGRNEGTVTGNSYSTSLVTGATSVGGLIGSNYSAVSDVATGHGGSAGPVVTGASGTGGLIGYNNGTVTNTVATGAVSGSADYTGGLIGLNDTSGAVSGSQASGVVSGTNTVGGLIGSLTGGTVANSSATGAVTGNSQVGGFVGSTSSGSTITASMASGAVSAVSTAGGFVGSNGTVLAGALNALSGNTTTSTVTVSSGQAGGFAGANSGTLADMGNTNSLIINTAVQDVGGIVGLNKGIVQNSHAVNTVQAALATNVGGAVGRNDTTGSVTRTYADNSVTGGDATGGLIGANNGSATIAYSSGTVSGHDNVGGLIGKQGSTGSAANAYAAAATSGNDHVGGLIGYGGGSVSYTYATGAVGSAGSHAGGLLGSTNGATVSNSVFSLSGTGRSHSTGDYAGGEVAAGKTSAEMMQAATYAGWNLSTTGSHDKIWRSYDGLAAPLLVNWLTPFTVNATGGTASYVYDGTVHSVSPASVSYPVAPEPGLLLGTAGVSGKNAGVYTGSGYYSIQQGYDIVASGSTLTITPAQLSAAVAPVSRGYDGTTAASLAAGQVALTGFVGGDSAATKALTGNFNSKDVAAATSVTFALSGADLNLGTGTLLSNYSLPASVTGAGTITRAVLGASLAPVSKVYDGSTGVVIDPGAVTLTGFVGGEGATASGVVGNFNSKNVTEANSVTATVTGATGTGSTDLGNYVLPASLTAAGTITAKAVTASIASADKIYDGTDSALAQLDVNGLVQGDQVVLTGSGRFNDKNAGVGKAVSITSISSDSAAASNYAIAGGAITGTATITPKSVTVAASAQDKIYDGGTAAAVALTGSGVIAGDQVSFSGSGSFADKNVGVGKTVTVAAITGAGADAGNYQFISDSVVTTAASITPRLLTLQATGSDKEYDGSVADSVSVSASGLVEGDVFAITGVGSFADKNAGRDKAVTVTGLQASGADAGNYTYAAGPLGTTASITPKTVSLSATAGDKVYDGTAAGSVVLGASGVLAGDQIGFSGSASFADKNVGAGKTVTVGSITASGADAGNYRTDGQAVTGMASITARQLTVTATGTDKVYDGKLDDVVNLGVNGLVAGDAVQVSGRGSFSDKNVGTAKVVTVSDIAGSGADFGNYSLVTTGVATTASITARALTVTASASDKVYDGSLAAAVTLGADGVLDGDSVSFSGTGAFADRNVGTGKTVTVSGIAASGADAANYSYNGSAGAQAGITARQLTVSLAGTAGKVFDGNANATLGSGNYNVGNLVAGESITVSQAAGQYADAQVGSGKLVSTTLAAADYAAGANTALSNYSIVTGALSGAIGTITVGTENATFNSPGITGSAGDVSLPLAFNGGVASLPNPATGGDQRGAGSNGSEPAGTVRTTALVPGADNPLAPAQPSAVSAHTRENLLLRRAVSISDGGIRLPQGVRGSDLDAPQ